MFLCILYSRYYCHLPFFLPVYLACSQYCLPPALLPFSLYFELAILWQGRTTTSVLVGPITYMVSAIFSLNLRKKLNFMFYFNWGNTISDLMGFSERTKRIAGIAEWFSFRDIRIKWLIQR